MASPSEKSNLWDKRGRFEIPDRIFRGSPEIIGRIMAKCLVYRCEYLVDRMVFEYYGYCHEFDPITNGDRAPTYEWQVTKGQEPQAKRIAN